MNKIYVDVLDNQIDSLLENIKNIKDLSMTKIREYIQKEKGKINSTPWTYGGIKVDEYFLTFNIENNDDLKFFSFHIYLDQMPERFVLEVVGNDIYDGFLITCNSDSSQRDIRIDKPLLENLADEEKSKSLKDEFLKSDKYFYW